MRCGAHELHLECVQCMTNAASLVTRVHCLPAYSDGLSDCSNAHRGRGYSIRHYGVCCTEGLEALQLRKLRLTVLTISADNYLKSDNRYL